MIYSDFKGEKLSLLGFGAMRLPMDANGNIDEEQVFRMTDLAVEKGVNYFDTAYPYHEGESERVIGRALKRYPRDKFYLATKYPGHQISLSYDPKAVFEDQLKKCGVDYFDFYLLHNVCESSMSTYEDERWGIIDYFKEQKRLGRIKHLGFSTHGQTDTIEGFLSRHEGDMEFCQIQLNYLDWTLQKAKEKYEMLTARGIPVWVMESVRGGKLAKLSDEDEAALNALRPGESMASWSLRFLQGFEGVKMILSGMSNYEQMLDNVKTFETRRPLSQAEINALLSIAEGMKDTVPCTGCRYCCHGCPMELDIPLFLSLYNELRFAPAINISMRIESLPEDKRPSACLACGECAKACPQGIDVPHMLKDFSERLKTVPSWADICRRREEAQKRQAGR